MEPNHTAEPIAIVGMGKPNEQRRYDMSLTIHSMSIAGGSHFAVQALGPFGAGTVCTVRRS